MCISGIYAYNNITKTEIKNSMKISAVNIGIEKYTLINNQEILYTGSNQLFMPGSDISFIFRIFNYGEKCYLRVKVELDYDGLSIINKEDIIGMNNNFKEISDYYYDIIPFEENSKIDAFKGIKIPTTLGNEYQDSDLNLKVTVEAIQAKNFFPNFNSNSPWGDILIEKCIEEEYTINFEEENSIVEIIYENNAENYVNIPDSFFGSINRLVPGDIETQDIFINNNSLKEINIFFKTEAPTNQDERKIQLLKALNLVITLDDKILYNGDLYTTKEYFLGTFKPNTYSKMKFKLVIPLNLNNEYSINYGKLMKWYFSVGEENSELFIQTKEEKTLHNNETKRPLTGDYIDISLIIFFISAFGLVFVMFIERRNKKRRV